MSTPPIAFAVLGGDLDLVKQRVAAGADINEVTNKGTALHVSCIYRREEIGRFLLENGANPRAKDKYGRMPIDVAEDTEMVALLREYGVREFGIHDYNNLKRESQKNAFVLGNLNDVDTLAELLDPIDEYHGFYAPWFSIPHLHELEDRFELKRTAPESATATLDDKCPKLHAVDTLLLRKSDATDEVLFDHAETISKRRPFKKMDYWDKYRVFQLLCNLRSLNFIAKKRKLRLFFQQWDLSADE